MATKTVVCPECGSAAGPARYACAECGAMLAAVGPAQRTRKAAAGTAADADLARIGQPEGANQLDGTDPIGPADVLHDLLSSAPTDDTTAATAATVATAPSDSIAATAAIATAPSWPPAGDHGPLPAPEPRTPAGAYLPPSAVLPPLDGAIAVGGLAGPIGTGAIAFAARSGAIPDSAPSAPIGSWVGRGSAALTDGLGSIRVPAETSRGAVAVGAGLAAVGILLPWVNTLPGANPLANYLDRWGLAGPGLWLVLMGLLALGAVAASSGRAASWPVGLPAIIVAAFLVGLVWPYVAGAFGRSIGIWFVSCGAIVLLVGGLLDRRGRHDRGDAPV
jgi:hypothetical protein